MPCAQASLFSPSPRLYLPPPASSPSARYEEIPEPTSSYLPFRIETFSSEVAAMTMELHKALHRFRPVSDQYASMPFNEAFNWEELELPEEIERDWFAVVIQSKQRDGNNTAGRTCLPCTVMT